MAPPPSRRLQVPSVSMDEAYYSTNTLTSTTPTSDDFSSGSPRTLYAQTFELPKSSRSMPPAPKPTPRPSYHKNMMTFTGYQTTEEEFDTLPLVMQRKYFSTLERLRFAESSRSNALRELPVQRTKSTTLAGRRGVNVSPIIEPPRNSISPRRLRKASRTQSIKSVTSIEASWYLTLPEKIKKKQFTREEQVILAGRLRESVILDAADEAIYKKSRRASKNVSNLSPVTDYSPSPDWPSPMSEEQMASGEGTIDQSLYESFRWMDEEQDLDLKLVLDDYHANLEGAVIPAPDSNTRPSFRRTMSISKIPFGRNSLSSLGPRSPKFETHHSRQKSKALSMMVPKHIAHNSVSSIDLPNATHYQDPEARLKLRVYLASPQKFDEAIEFGFPNMDGVTDDKENRPPGISSDRGAKTHSTETGHSFFLNEIDTISLFEDDTSMVDPDSPLTPIDRDITYRSQHGSSSSYMRGSKISNDLSYNGSNKPTVGKPHEAYTHAMAGSREMTLRMTLTRPDLRADENIIYGWQTPSKPPQQEPLTVQDMEDRHTRGPFGGIDGWGADEEKENGVVKRFWNKVKSSGTQRKVSGVPLKSG